jgi:thiol-disulfide isomerase/thioredoxin
MILGNQICEERSMRKLMLGLAFMLSVNGIAFAQCEMPVAVRELLENPAMQRQLYETQAQRDARAAAFKKAVAQFPDNYFILRAQMTTMSDPDERFSWASDLRKQHPDDPVYQMLEAESLLGKDTPEAIRRFEAVKVGHPEIPNVYLSLAGARSGMFLDKERSQKDLDGYIGLCSQSVSLDGLFLNLIQQSGTPEQVAHTAAAARKRLETDPNETRTAPWEKLWSLEFKANPASEHPAVRTRIKEDLAKFENSPRRQEVRFMQFLKSGYESAGDPAAVERLNEEILKLHPQSEQAKKILQKQWSEKHPWPGRKDKAALEAFSRASLAAAREWHQRWPDDSMILFTIFSDLSRLPETTSSQIAASVDAFLAAYRKGASWLNNPPFEFSIAEEYIKHKIRLLQVPSLIIRGNESMARMYGPILTDDHMDPEFRTSLSDSMDRTRIDGAHLLLDCYAATKQPQKSKEVLAELASIDSSKEPKNWEMMSLRAQAAEIEGRKLDALMMYRSALDMRGANPSTTDERDRLADNFQRLWRQMGGTQEGLGLPVGKKKIHELTNSQWERSKSILPSFSLKDFDGKNWSLAKLGGKALLINVWATWCGPCVAEHREFQKVYDKLKDRGDIAVLSFNVDEDIGIVVPYMTQHRYTFPVLPAADMVNSVKPSLTIPQNWLVSPDGKLEWEQTGYSVDDSKWQDGIIAKMEELLKKQ